ncbi:MAG: hypothetical protein R3Y56_10285 [Akkermansia sp.]
MSEAAWMVLERCCAELQLLQPRIQGSIHPTAVIDGVLDLGEGSVIKAGSVIEGHVRIGKDCIIGPNAYLRGCCSVGDASKVGHAVEMKDSILGHHVFISHLSYIGDSLIEDDVNLGGGCITSNFRHDAGEIRMMHEGQLCPTGRNKLGAYIQTGSRIGCNSVVLPGRTIPPHTWIEAGTIVR